MIFDNKMCEKYHAESDEKKGISISRFLSFIDKSLTYVALLLCVIV